MRTAGDVPFLLGHGGVRPRTLCSTMRRPNDDTGGMGSHREPRLCPAPPWRVCQSLVDRAGW
jgi:hypothetical protein